MADNAAAHNAQLMYHTNLNLIMIAYVIYTPEVHEYYKEP